MQSLVNRKRIRALRKMKFWRRHKNTGFNKPRLCVFRSSNHIQAQIINDQKGAVLACASSMESSMKALNLRGKPMAEKIGAILAERALKAGVTTVVFDRNGYIYHGRISAFADAARASGLNF